MPVISWIPCETFGAAAPPTPGWTPCETFGDLAPRAKKRPRPQPKRKRKCRRKPARRKAAFTPQVRSLMIDRLEAAVESGAIDLHDDPEHCDQLAITSGEYALLLRLLFPEDYLEPRQPTGATTTAPGSPDRIAEYRSRVETGRGIYDAGDAQPGMVGGRGMKVVSRRNGSGHQVLGWADEE